jgi:hypothetical protein
MPIEGGSSSQAARLLRVGGIILIDRTLAEYGGPGRIEWATPFRAPCKRE